MPGLGGGQGAELFREIDEGAQTRRLFRADRGKIHRIGLALQIIRHLCSATCKATFSCAADRQCGADNDTAPSEYTTSGGSRLLGEHVESGPGDMAAVERGAQSLFVHQSAAGAIDDAHPRQRPWHRVQYVFRFVGERRVQAYQLVPGAQCLSAFGGRNGS